MTHDITLNVIRQSSWLAALAMPVSSNDGLLRLTFDMSGDRRHAKHAVGRRLDGGVRAHATYRALRLDSNRTVLESQRH